MGKGRGRRGEVFVVLAGSGTKSREGVCQSRENGDMLKQRVVGIVEAAGRGGGERGEGL